MPHTSPESSLIKVTGGFGSIFATDTTTYTGEFHAIQAIDDCTFLILESTNMENVDRWVTLEKTLYAGMVLEASFTRIKLGTGCAMLYKH
jgi:hypothetical protein